MTDWVKEADKLKQTPKPKPKTPLLRKRETKDSLDVLYLTAILDSYTSPSVLGRIHSNS
jgi:hypothetical protein